MRWQSIACDFDVNVESLRHIREFLELEWYEKEYNRDDFPELSFLYDEEGDSLIVEMREELLASMN